MKASVVNPLVMRQDCGSAAQRVTSSNSRVVGLPQALVPSVNHGIRPEGPTVPSIHHASFSRRAGERMQPNGRPFRPLFISVDQLPGPPADLRPWLLESPATLGLNECGLFWAWHSALHN